MRRFTFAIAAFAALLVLAPASALAHHRGHSRSLHAKTHHARIRRFGDVSGKTTGTTPTSTSGNVGTVSSFQNGVLTITLNDGSTVTGNVTNDTSCTSSGGSSGSNTSSGGDDQSDQSSSGSNTSSGGDDQSDQGSSGSDQSDQGSSSGDDDQGEAQGSTSGSSGGSCSSANLAKGAQVQAAELRISSAGNDWEKVELA